MQKKYFTPIIFFSVLFFSNPVFSESMTSSYLCDMGLTYYKQGRYDEALSEFNKVLTIDPNNKEAKRYINDIFKKQNPPQAQENAYDDAFALAQEKRSAQTSLGSPRIAPKAIKAVAVKPELTKDQAMDQALNKLQTKKSRSIYPQTLTDNNEQNERGIKIQN